MKHYYANTGVFKTVYSEEMAVHCAGQRIHMQGLESMSQASSVPSNLSRYWASEGDIRLFSLHVHDFFLTVKWLVYIGVA